MTDTNPFSPTAPLAARTLIEASAGTGKTYALCGLATYLLGSGTTVAGKELTINNLLVVTFTTVATDDLKNRIRERIRSVRDALRSNDETSQDEVVVALRNEQVQEEAIRRLDVALSDFGDLAVSTIHGFAQRSIALHGATVGLEPDLPVITDDQPQLMAAVTDELAKQAATLAPVTCGVTARDTAKALGVSAVDELSWVPPVKRVLNVARVVSSVPGIALLPKDELGFATFAELVARHQSSYDELVQSALDQSVEFEEQIESIDRALEEVKAKKSEPTKKKRSIKGKLDTRISNLERETQDEKRQKLQREIDDFEAELVAVEETIKGLKDYTGVLDAEKAERKAANKELVNGIEPWLDESEIVRSTWIAQRAIDHAQVHRSRQGVRSYGDLLIHLRDALADPTSGAGLAERIRGQFSVALIDEFQDTDRVQWEIFDACFGHGETSRLVVVGDPKQAIYRFRGADIYTYAHVASRDDVAKQTLDTNHRSDGAVLCAIATLLSGVSFGDAAPFRPVAMSTVNPWCGIRWRSDLSENTRPLTALRIATLNGQGDNDELNIHDLDLVDADLVDWIRRLRHGAELRTTSCDPQGHANGDDVFWRNVGYDDIALLVTRNSEAARLQHLLGRYGVPAVVHTDIDVRHDPIRSRFDFVTDGYSHAPSEAAWNWQLLLEAMANPSDRRCCRAALTTVFAPDGFDWPHLLANDFDDHANKAFEGFQAQIASWTKTLTESGPGAFNARLRSDTPWLRRAVQRGDANQFMTDLAHIGELFSELDSHGLPSVDDLLHLLESDDSFSGQTATVARRTASTDPSVTIMTLHKAKGLEFPIVGCLGLDKSRRPQKENKGARQAARFHADATGSNVETLDAARQEASLDAEWKESTADDLRKLYVALTRGKHHVFTYCSDPAKLDPKSNIVGPLPRVLFNRDADGELDVAAFVESGERRPQPPVTNDSGSTDPSPQPAEILARLVDRSCATSRKPNESGPTISCEDIAEFAIDLDDDHAGESNTSANEKLNTTTLAAADVGERRFDWRTTQWSFTLMHRTMKNRSVIGDAPTAGGTDEGDNETEGDGANDGESSDKGPHNTALQRLAAGTAFGTFTHKILECLDFPSASSDTIARLARAQPNLPKNEFLPRPSGGAKTTSEGVAVFATGLLNALHAPIGPYGPGGVTLCLRDITARDRLSECDFTLRLKPGTDQDTTVHRVGMLICAHLDNDDPYYPWAQRLTQGRFDLDLMGYLTGSIDLVYRVAHPDGSTRFHLADYKTNKSPAANYSPESLAKVMAKNDYPLQALLYQVALHRYLRLRLGRRYDPRAQLGTVTYLFLRGMSANANGTAGVARWDIPVDLIVELDALFAGSQGGLP